MSLPQIYVPPKNPSHINSNFDIFTESSALFLHNNDHRLYLAIYSYTYLIGINEHIILFSNCIPRGLPWWHSGWESACRCRGHGFEPWSGKIPHAAEQLGPWTTVTEPARLEPVLHNKRGRNNERPAHRDEERPPLAATRESPRAETKTQHSHK